MSFDGHIWGDSIRSRSGQRDVAPSSTLSRRYASVAKDGANQPDRGQSTSGRYPKDKLHRITEHMGDLVIHQTGPTGYEPSQYSLGDIIRAPHVAPSLDPRASLTQREVATVDAIGPVVGKLRPAIVVGIYKKTMTCLPMFTSGGKGCSPAEADDCLWLRQWDDDGPMWVDKHKSKYLMLDPSSRCEGGGFTNLTKAFAVEYQYPITFMGRLTSKSRQRLIDTWKVILEQGLVPYKDQKYFAETNIRKIPVEDEYAEIRRAESNRKRDEREGFTTVTSKRLSRY